MKKIISFFLLGITFGCNSPKVEKQKAQIDDSSNISILKDSITNTSIQNEKLISFFPSNEEFMQHYKNSSGVYDITSGMMNKLDFICLPEGIRYKHAFVNLYHRFDEYPGLVINDAVVYTSYLKYGWGLYDTSIIINGFEVNSNYFRLMEKLPIKIGDTFSTINRAVIDTSLSESVFVIKYSDCNMAIKIDADTVKRLFVWKSCHDSLLKYAYNGMAKSLERTIYPNDSYKSINEKIERYKKQKRINDSIEFIRLNEENINNVVDSIENRDFK